MADPPSGGRPEGARAAEGAAGGVRLRLARLASGLSQEQLAARAQVSRQAVAGIEKGRFDPSLRVALDLARALGRSVEDLFGPPAERPPRPAALLRGARGPSEPTASVGLRVDVGEVGGRMVALGLGGDEGIRAGFVPATGHVVGGVGAGDAGGDPAEGAPFEEVLVAAGPEGMPAVVVAGCDPALGLLAGPLAALSPPRRLAWWPCNSAAALALAAAGLVHAAGVHAPEGGPGIAAAAEDALGGVGAEVIGFSAWREGLAARRGGAGEGLDVAGIAEAGLRIVNREDGSEARHLLDAELARAGIPCSAVAGYGTRVRAHLLVASAVAAGLGDAGVTIEPAARAFGLSFTPLAAEVFQLVVPTPTLHTAETSALLHALAAPSLRAELGRLAGYDPATCGAAVATV